MVVPSQITLICLWGDFQSNGSLVSKPRIRAGAQRITYFNLVQSMYFDSIILFYCRLYKHNTLLSLFTMKYWNPKVHNRVHIISSLDVILSHLNLLSTKVHNCVHIISSLDVILSYLNLLSTIPSPSVSSIFIWNNPPTLLQDFPLLHVSLTLPPTPHTNPDYYCPLLLNEVCELFTAVFIDLCVILFLSSNGANRAVGVDTDRKRLRLVESLVHNEPTMQQFFPLMATLTNASVLFTFFFSNVSQLLLGDLCCFSNLCSLLCDTERICYPFCFNYIRCSDVRVVLTMSPNNSIDPSSSGEADSTPS
jgi:hypothetical protein